MSQWSQWFSLPTWLSGSSTGAAHQLVEERNGSLRANTEHIDKIAQTTERLRAFYGKIKQENPTLFTGFTPQEPTTWEMAEQLKIIVLASASNLSSVSQDLDAIRDKRILLERIVEIWEKIEKNFDKAIAAGREMKQLDLQNVEDLSDLVQAMQKLGVPPNCRSV